MRIRVQVRFQIQLINFYVDPDFHLMRMQIQVNKMMRIQIHNTAFYYIVLCCVLQPVLYCTVYS
jgi:hypothetical protein